jgi:hypothetical protein
MKTQYYIIEKGQKLVNLNGSVYACHIDFTVWGTAIMMEKNYAFSFETKKAAAAAAKEYSNEFIQYSFSKEVLTEQEFYSIREY